MQAQHRRMIVSFISFLLAACGGQVGLGDLGGLDGGSTGSGGTTGTGGGTTGTGGSTTGSGGSAGTGSGGSAGTGSGGPGPGGAGGAGGSTGLCASGSRWIEGSAPSALMNPGRACMDSGCHSSTSKTPFTMAGTMYPPSGLHDDNDCNGTDSSMVPSAVEITEVSGELPIPRLQVSPAGNFYTAKQLPPSFYVRVITQGREAKMVSLVTNGNCNACHTPDGFMGAMGRIVEPSPVP